MVGDLRYDPGFGKVIDLISADRVVWAEYPSTSIDDNLSHGEDIVVLQYGNLTDGHMDIVDRAIERGVPVLEYK